MSELWLKLETSVKWALLIKSYCSVLFQSYRPYVDACGCLMHFATPDLQNSIESTIKKFCRKSLWPYVCCLCDICAVYLSYSTDCLRLHVALLFMSY
uniref:Uncharacterized protein n=1 Tax=Parascaris univalens TaxID=6257 RepID=A0A915A7Q2_PARUN